MVSSLTRFSQTRGIVASLTSHQQHFSADTFFRHVTAVAARKVFWGPGSDGGKGGDPGGPDGGKGGGDPEDPR